MDYEKKLWGNGKICSELYYKNDNIHREVHRENEPAYISYYNNGNKKGEVYCINGELHRLDGPATIRYNENGDITHQGYWIHENCYEDVFLYSVEVGSLKGE